MKDHVFIGKKPGLSFGTHSAQVLRPGDINKKKKKNNNLPENHRRVEKQQKSS